MTTIEWKVEADRRAAQDEEITASNFAQPGDIECEHVDAEGKQDTSWLYGYDAWNVKI